MVAQPGCGHPSVIPTLAVVRGLTICVLPSLLLSGSSIEGAQEGRRPTRVVRSWIAGCGTGEDLWKHRESTTVKCDPWGRYLVGTEGTFVWPVDLPSSRIDEILIFGEDLDTVDFVFHWASPGQDFSGERSVDIVETSPDKTRARLIVGDHPAWSGELRRFRLSWSGKPEKTTRLHEVRVEARASASGGSVFP